MINCKSLYFRYCRVSPADEGIAETCELNDSSDVVFVGNVTQLNVVSQIGYDSRTTLNQSSLFHSTV